jgi:asparagine synthase (glutamine-hydrolysing)
MPRFSAIFSNTHLEKLPGLAKEMDGERLFPVSNEVVFALTRHLSGKSCFFSFENLSAVGEVVIYNREELKLKADSDGELLLKLYARDGIKAFSRIEGMFSAAVFDGENLILVRDPIGKKTLFYTRTKNFFAASSSLRSLRRFPGLEVKLNLHAVASFLTFAYLPGDETLLENVF